MISVHSATDCVADFTCVASHNWFYVRGLTHHKPFFQTSRQAGNLFAGASTFYSIIERPWALVLSGFYPTTSRAVVRCSTNWANRLEAFMSTTTSQRKCYFILLFKSRPRVATKGQKVLHFFRLLKFERSTLELTFYPWSDSNFVSFSCVSEDDKEMHKEFV